MPSQYFPYLSRLSAIARSSRSKNSCMISRSSISFLLRVHGALTLYTDKTVAGMSTIMENFVFFSDALPAMLLQYTIPTGLCQIWLAVPMAFESEATDAGKGISATATRDPLKIPVYILYLWAFFFLLVSHQLLHYIN
ncbi:MAG: hypothetical protein DBX65_05175 [Oscillospiraceae bacterium]|nr:MAG: hypothetical protein DBX65_05175 [Oscillospiraceae bacterium]